MERQRAKRAKSAKEIDWKKFVRGPSYCRAMPTWSAVRIARERTPKTLFGEFGVFGSLAFHPGGRDGLSDRPRVNAENLFGEFGVFGSLAFHLGGREPPCGKQPAVGVGHQLRNHLQEQIARE